VACLLLSITLPATDCETGDWKLHTRQRAGIVIDIFHCPAAPTKSR